MKERAKYYLDFFVFVKVYSLRNAGGEKLGFFGFGGDVNFSLRAVLALDDASFFGLTAVARHVTFLAASAASVGLFAFRCSVLLGTALETAPVAFRGRGTVSFAVAVFSAVVTTSLASFGRLWAISFVVTVLTTVEAATFTRLFVRAAASPSVAGATPSVCTCTPRITPSGVSTITPTVSHYVFSKIQAKTSGKLDASNDHKLRIPPLQAWQTL